MKRSRYWIDSDRVITKPHLFLSTTAQEVLCALVMMSVSLWAVTSREKVVIHFATFLVLLLDHQRERLTHLIIIIIIVAIVIIEIIFIRYCVGWTGYYILLPILSATTSSNSYRDTLLRVPLNLLNLLKYFISLITAWALLGGRQIERHRQTGSPLSTGVFYGIDPLYFTDMTSFEHFD